MALGMRSNVSVSPRRSPLTENAPRTGDAGLPGRFDLPQEQVLVVVRQLALDAQRPGRGGCLIGCVVRLLVSGARDPRDARARIRLGDVAARGGSSHGGQPGSGIVRDGRWRRTMSATDARMSAAPATIHGVMLSPRTAQPRATATTGLT